MERKKIRFWFLWLSLICVIAFVLQNIVNGFTDMFILNLSALYGFQIWRFVTAIFLHGGIVHLIYNLFALLLFGFILERIIGSRNFLIVFFLSGIIGNLVSVNFYPSSLGASGAIYGVIGCVAILEPMMMVWAFGLLMPMFVAAILWIAGGVLGMLGMFNDNTGYVAHLSGIVIGIISGIVFRIIYTRKKKKLEEKMIIPDDYVGEWEERFVK